MRQNVFLPSTRAQPNGARRRERRASVARLRPALCLALVALAAATSCAATTVLQKSKAMLLPAGPQPPHVVGPPPVTQVGPHVVSPASWKGGALACPPYPPSLTAQPTPVTYAGPAGTASNVTWRAGTSGVPAGAKLTSGQFEIRLASDPSQVLLQQSATASMTVNAAPTLLPTPANPHPAAACPGAPSSASGSEMLTLNGGQLQGFQSAYGFQALQHLVLWRSFTYLDSQGLVHPVQVSNPLSIVAAAPIH